MDLLRLLRLGEMIEGEITHTSLREQVRVQCIPVKREGRTIAVMTRMPAARAASASATRRSTPYASRTTATSAPASPSTPTISTSIRPCSAALLTLALTAVVVYPVILFGALFVLLGVRTWSKRAPTGEQPEPLVQQLGDLGRRQGHGRGERGAHRALRVGRDEDEAAGVVGLLPNLRVQQERPL